MSDRHSSVEPLSPKDMGGEKGMSFEDIEEEKQTITEHTLEQTSSPDNYSPASAAIGSGQSTDSPHPLTSESEPPQPDETESRPITVQQPTFTIFQELPLATRAEIFLLACPARVIIITPDKDRIRARQAQMSEQEYAQGGQNLFLAKATFRNPSILSINKESRALGLLRYRKTFGGQLGGREIYFDHAQDMLLFEDKMALRHFYGGTLISESSALAGFAYDMNPVHQNVRFVSVAGLLKDHVGTIGWTLNLYKELRSATVGEAIHTSPLSGDALRECLKGECVPWDVWADIVDRRNDELGNMPQMRVLRADPTLTECWKEQNFLRMLAVLRYTNWEVPEMDA